MIEKALLLAEVRRIITRKISGLESLIASTRAANNETKSSMGDKYETSREMVQQEVNRLLSQLAEAQNQLHSIQRLTGDANTELKSGALFRTTKGLFYISAALGEVEVNGKKIYAVSPESPLVKAFYGKKAGEQGSFGNQVLVVEEIW